MKKSRASKRLELPRRARTYAPAQVSSDEQEAHRQWYKAMKWAEYDAKQEELRETGNREARYVAVIKAIHDFAEYDEWFAVNTPYPFRKSHWSNIPILAQVCCRYLQEIARAGNENAIRELASVTVEMTETLMALLRAETKTAKQNAELMQGVSRELPYWPTLHFANTAANNYFPRVAELLELGKECPINVSGSANYSLETPINQFVWSCLRHFQQVHWHIRYEESQGQAHDESLERLIFQEMTPPVAHKKFVAGMIHREEIPIYKVSFRLPPLSKRVAQVWADKAIMPYLDAINTDYFNDPRFRTIQNRKRVKSRSTARAEIRKDVIRALNSMARPGAPKNVAS